MSLEESIELSDSLNIKLKILYLNNGIIDIFESKSWQNMTYE